MSVIHPLDLESPGGVFEREKDGHEVLRFEFRRETVDLDYVSEIVVWSTWRPTKIVRGRLASVFMVVCLRPAHTNFANSVVQLQQKY